jgi:adenine C2-methylase RlmN of 23S rRNA A2503 and tRNA A37
MENKDKDVKGRLAQRLEKAMKEYLPKEYNRMKKNGTLDQYVLDKQEQANQMMDRLRGQGYDLITAEEIVNPILMEIIPE